jgi:tRNA/tmRNA/rRNA uracil-C5-methylase (TrmA/RlmC/RlmD family)
MTSSTAMLSMRAGDEITITPTELVAGGAAMARIDGFPIFATNVYPGDVAVVRLREVKKGFAHADLVRIVAPSPSRRIVPCPVANECGGCDWTALRLDTQLESKQRILTESLRRIGKIDPATLPPITIHPSPLNYRLRSRLHRDGDRIGFFATRTNEVVQLPVECEVVGLETARVLGVPGTAGVPPALGSCVDLDAGGTPAVPGTPAHSWWEVDGKLVTDGHLTIDGYHVTTDVFFQVNRHLLGTMRDLVTKLAMRVSGVVGRKSESALEANSSDSRPPTPDPRKSKTAIDLYSGVGFFSRPLAEIFDSVTAVEGAEAAHECAKRNVPENVTLVNAPVEWWVERMPRADFVFLDPPRSGAVRNVIDAIATRTNEMVCFLACDPVTFARDASRLIASGWRLASLDLLDLFPNTHHVETLASFERANSQP